MRRSSPWRRWVAPTLTMVTCAAGTTPPGIVRSRVNAETMPTIAPFWVATMDRAGSNTLCSSSFHSSSMSSLNASPMSLDTIGQSSSTAVRNS